MKKTFYYFFIMLVVLNACSLVSEPTVELVNVNVNNISPRLGGVDITGTLDYKYVEKITSVTCYICSDSSFKSAVKTTVALSGNKFNVSFSELEGRKKYYFQFKIDNSVSSMYSKKYNFETTGPEIITSSATNILAATATLSVTIKALNNAKLVEMGLCWGLNNSPTLQDSKNSTKNFSSSYTIEVKGLMPDKQYFSRGFVIDDKGVITYGNIVEFKTTSGLPKISTSATSSILYTTATFNGIVNDDGGYPISKKGFVYSKDKNPTLTDKVVYSENSNLGSYSCAITGLSDNTTYYVRAFATNQYGTSYGEQVSFKTLELPEIKTGSANLTSTEFYFQGFYTYNKYNVSYTVDLSTAAYVSELGIRVKMLGSDSFQNFYASSVSKGNTTIYIYHLSQNTYITVYYQAFVKLNNGEYIYGEEKNKSFSFY